MNYIQVIQDSLRLFRTQKLIWAFGFLSILMETQQLYYPFMRENPILACIVPLVTVAILIISSTAQGGLIYVIGQASANKELSFSEAWLQGKSKVGSLIVILLLILPIALIGGLLSNNMAAKFPASPFLWLFPLIFSTYSSFYTFGTCAIIIDNVKVWPAAWTSLLITLNNFFRVIVITGSIFLIRLLLIGAIVVMINAGLVRIGLPIPLTLDYPTYLKLVATPLISTATWILDWFLVPLETIILTFGYFKFTKEIAYPVLSHRQPTA